MVSGFLWTIVIGMEQVMHINTLDSIIYEWIRNHRRRRGRIECDVVEDVNQ